VFVYENVPLVVLTHCFSLLNEYHSENFALLYQLKYVAIVIGRPVKCD
jgi:hypothetical protein